jgi:hypothetical protein
VGTEGGENNAKRVQKTGNFGLVKANENEVAQYVYFPLSTVGGHGNFEV